MAATMSKRNGVPWDGDRISADTMSSLDVLFEWLSTNYTRWRAEHSKRTRGARAAPGVVVSKEILCQEIVGKLHAQGLAHRSSREVRSKINDLERSHRVAVEWKTSTGDDQYVDKATARKKLLKMCRYFDMLDPIMRDYLPAPRPARRNGDEEKVSDGGDENGHDGSEVADVDYSDEDDEHPYPTNGAVAIPPPVLAPLPPPPPPAHPVLALTSAPAPAQGNQQPPVNPVNNKRPPTVLDMWRELATAAADQERAAVEREKLRIETKRLRLDEAKIDLESEKIRWEIERSRIQAIKEKALA